jgi:hypothetical protein
VTPAAHEEPQTPPTPADAEQRTDPRDPHRATAAKARSQTGGMLPGMAAIEIYVLFVSMFTAFKMIGLKTMPAGVRFSILSICTLVVIGAFGMLRLRRWGWALVTGGCLFGAVANFFAFHTTHIGAYLIQGLFALVFFLYLSRTEVRDRVH